MKTRYWIGFLSLSLTVVASYPAIASTDSIDAMARVIKYSERYVTVRESRPTEECREVTVSGSKGSTSSDTPELLGAIVGGALGKNISNDKDGKTGAIIGGLLGASIASDLEKKNAESKRTPSRTEVRCSTVHREVEVQRIDGYDVTYEYNGHLFTSQTKTPPGNAIPVKIYVLPAQ